MDIDAIMDAFSVFGEEQPVPVDALREAERQRDALTPILLERLDWLLENVQKGTPDIFDFPEYSQSWYAFFLLAQFREKRAYPKYIRLLRLNEDQLETALGDAVNSVGHFLYSTYDGDLDSALAVAADSSLDPFARSAALDLTKGLFFDGRLDRDTMIKIARERIAAVKIGDYDEELFSSMLIGLVADANLVELIDDVRTLVRSWQTDVANGDNFSDFFDTLFSEAPPASRTHIVEDAAAELSKWGCFEKDPSSPEIYEIMSWDVGRNDPCPCGSGKKFKKCCLKKLEEWERNFNSIFSDPMSRYPSTSAHDGIPGLADLFSEDAIAVDTSAYHALHMLDNPPEQMHMTEYQVRKQSIALLSDAFLLTQKICAEHGFKTPAEFDREYSLHYDCVEWLDVLSDLLSSSDPLLPEVEAFLHS